MHVAAATLNADVEIWGGGGKRLEGMRLGGAACSAWGWWFWGRGGKYRWKGVDRRRRAGQG
eukprot:267062-Rhodomonas_salina.1